MRYLISFLFAGLLCAPQSTSASLLAQFRTSLGDMEVELFDQSKPETVQNFVRYVQEGYTNDMIFHRWHKGDIQVLQGGGFYTPDQGETFHAIHTFDPITNEFSSGRIFSNVYGTIAMARLSITSTNGTAIILTNSATSQWYFNLSDNSSLDAIGGGYTVFGRVLRGTNFLELFKQPTNRVVYPQAIPLSTSLPEVPFRITKIEGGTNYLDLIYVDITLLDVHVRSTAAGLSEISWQSVSNKVNRVEFTPQFPPVWTELFTTNGTGNLMQFVDPQPGATNRFYRVRVDY